MDETVDIYTDGSHTQGQCAWAFVVVQDGEVLARHAGRMTDMDAELAAQNNVAAEMKAAINAAAWAKANGVRCRIFADYVGVRAWVTGEWSAGNSYTKQFRRYMKGAPVENIEIVEGHSGVRYNEMVDRMSRSAAIDGAT